MKKKHTEKKDVRNYDYCILMSLGVLKFYSSGFHAHLALNHRYVIQMISMAARSTYRLKISKRRFRSYFWFPDIAKCHRDNDCLFAISFHVDLPIWPLGRSVQNANASSVISINYLISLFGTLNISLSLSLSSFTLVIAEIILEEKESLLITCAYTFLFSFASIEVEDHLSTSHDDESREDTFSWLRKVIWLRRSYLRNEILKWCS